MTGIGHGVETVEFLRGYKAGAADMEAGRLVTGLWDASIRNAEEHRIGLLEAEVESLRGQLEVARDQADLAVGLRKAAEAKLAEVTEQLRIERERK